jgi:hypothetical protein
VLTAASAGESTVVSKNRTFLTQAWEGDDRRMGGEQRGH